MQRTKIKGNASGLTVAGIGTVAYTFINGAQEKQVLTLHNVLYVPQCTSCLLCPRQIGHATGKPADGFYSNMDKSFLTIDGKCTMVSYDTTMQLPIIFTAPGITIFERFCANNSTLNSPTVHPSPESIPTAFSPMPPAQRHKLQLHEQCNHVNWVQLNTWICNGLLPCDPSIANVPNPVCAACQFGKAHKWSHHSDTGHIAKNAKFPGAPMVWRLESKVASWLHMVLLSHTTIVTAPFGCYITMHETKKVEELIRSKSGFEQFASKFGVTIKHLRAGNGMYAAHQFQDHCAQSRQPLTFCAISAHWQNGIAERFIGSIIQQARTILLRTMARWPQVITEDLWPYVVWHAVFFHNALVRKDKHLSPHELFTGESPTWKLNDFKVFGCPCYVLQKCLEDGDNYSKWKARSWHSVYVGYSSCHAGNVPLVFNPMTTHVTPQYRIVFDEGFTSIHSSSNDIASVNLSNL